MAISLCMIQGNIRLSVAAQTIESNLAIINTFVAGCGGAIGTCIAQTCWAKFKKIRSDRICNEIDDQMRLKADEDEDQIQ